MAKKPSVNKKDLILQVAAEFPDMNLSEIEAAVELILNEISTSLICGDRVELRGFGSLKVRKREKGSARNPRNGSSVSVDDRGALYFRASRDLVEILNANAANQ